MAIYSTTSSARTSASNPLIGKYDRPIRAIIEHESNLWEKRHSILDFLFNVEKSNRFAEAITAESGFGVFSGKTEGEAAAEDSTKETFTKYIEHIPFGKTFVITREMLDDAKMGMGTQMKQRPKAFVRSYYQTRIKLAAQALYNGTATTFTFGGKSVDISVPDGGTGGKVSLFSTAHKSADGTITQSNYFETTAITDVEKTLSILANKIRNFKDENGEPMGYVADVVIIPCNRPELERKVKAACGSERTTGNGNNDINTQYGNWTVVVLDGWESAHDAMMVMSKEANENLLGNMFYNRIELDITNEEEVKTRNWVWNGYCRFGVGFTTWKHIALVTTDTGASADSID
jgi:hypothetical protein